MNVLKLGFILLFAGFTSKGFSVPVASPSAAPAQCPANENFCRHVPPGFKHTDGTPVTNPKGEDQCCSQTIEFCRKELDAVNRCFPASAALCPGLVVKNGLPFAWACQKGDVCYTDGPTKLRFCLKAAYPVACSVVNGQIRSCPANYRCGSAGNNCVPQGATECPGGGFCRTGICAPGGQCKQQNGQYIPMPPKQNPFNVPPTL